MADKRAVVVESFDKPWKGTIENVRYGELNGSLDLTATESGFAAGVDLGDEEQPNVIASADRLRIQFRGSPEGCLTFDEANLSGIHAPTGDMLDITVRGTRLLRLDADDGLSFWSELGVARLAIRRHGDVASRGADIHTGDGGSLALSADSGVYVLINTDDIGQGAFRVGHGADTIDGSAPIFTVDQFYNVFGTYPDIAHGATDIVPETDAPWVIGVAETAAGGMKIIGLKDDSGSTGGGCVKIFGGLEENLSTAKSSAARGAVEVYGGQLSGTTWDDVVANGNVMVVRTRDSSAWVTRFIFDTEGSAHAEVEWTTFDDQDDIALLGSLEASFGQFADEHRNELERLGIARYDDKPGHAMVNWTRLSMLLVGAMRQERLRNNRIFEALGANPALLEA